MPKLFYWLRVFPSYIYTPRTSSENWKMAGILRFRDLKNRRTLCNYIIQVRALPYFKVL
jgi:hypothetical protein